MINGGCGDDGFMDFRDYLVSRGRKVFDRTLADPESLLDDQLSSNGSWHYEEMHFLSVASEVADSKNWSIDLFFPHPTGGVPGEFYNGDKAQFAKHFPRIHQHLEARRAAKAAVKKQSENN